MLTASNIVKRFGGLHALNDVTLQVRENTIHGLIGPNGSGKTTFFNILSGYEPLNEGSIEFKGIQISKKKAHQIARMGMARTFQHIELFKGSTVFDNIRTGAQCRTPPRLFQNLLRSGTVRREDEQSDRKSEQLAEFMGLGAEIGELAANLPYGNQRLVEIARAMATEPELLLLDEPAAGMNTLERERLVQIIRKIHKGGTTIILIEHDIRLVGQVAETVTVLDAGKMIAEGTPQEIQSDPEVIRAYIGEEEKRTSAFSSGFTAPENSEDLLTIQNLDTFYGHVHALRDISFSIKKGEYTALIGANGAGKSTLLKTISGTVKPRSGTLAYKNESINNLGADKIVALGIVQVPEGRGIFPGLTVLENLKIGAYLRKDGAAIRKDIDQVFELFPRLYERARQLGGSLSGGEQQMLAVGRAVMTRPELLLLDEPSMGLAPILADEVLATTRRLHEMGITILLVEQNAKAALEVADRAIVLEVGTIALEGPAPVLAQNDLVRKAYLGIS